MPQTISIPSSAPRAPIVPILQAIPRLSRQPVHDRRKGLEKLYQEYLKAYVKLSPTNPGLAAEHALTEEKSISVGTTTASYGPAIHSACVTIRQRPVPKSLTSPYVGINKEVKVKVQKWEEDKQSEPTRERAGRYMLTLDQMRTFGYVLGLPEVEGGTHPDAAGERKMCDRCGAEFVVKGKAEEGSEHQGSTGACVYHWGRATMERVDGHRMARWSCCGSDRSMNEPGCAFAEFHVFKDGKSWRFSERPSVADIEAREAAEEEEVEILHSREPFKSTKKVLREVYAALGDPGKKRKRSGVHEVLAMDCEMICEFSSGYLLAL
jgi:RNA exonuclease 1